MMNYKKIKRTFVRQHGQSDCGISCLASILKFHGGFATLDYLRQISGTTKFGTSMIGLKEASESVGFQAKGLEATSVDNLKELAQPAILHVLLHGKFQHYVVYYGFKGEDIIIGDPQSGIETWSKSKLDDMWQSKALIKLTPTDQIEKRRHQEKSLRWFLTILKEDLNILSSSLFLGILIALFSISTAIFSQQLIDTILPGKNLFKLILGLSLFALILFIKTGLGYVKGLFLITQGREFNKRLINQFYNALLFLPKQFFDSKKTGELVSRMNDTNRIQTVIGNMVGNILVELFLTIVSVIAIFIYNSELGFIVLTFIPFSALFLFFFTKSITSNQKEVMVLQAANESNYIDSITGISEIKSLNKQSFFSEVTSIIYENFQNRILQLGKIKIRFGLFLELVSILITVISIGYASLLIFHDKLKIGELVAVISLVGTIVPALTRTAGFYVQVQEAKVAFDRMKEFTSLQPENNNGKSDNLSFGESLIIENLSFNYPGNPALLQNISLSINPQNLTVLLGESGSGKSTLIQLIQRFYLPQSGKIYYGDCNILDIELYAYRGKLGVVSQHTKLFNNFLLFNIALSDDPNELENAKSWCEENGFGNYFKNFPRGYMTLLGEEGINISGGQRQLVAFARVLYHNPSLLIVDEGTSAMDKNTENFILELLHIKKKELAILMVTHKIKSALRADVVYILEKGSIVQNGHPRELIKSDNFFSESYRELQYHL